MSRQRPPRALVQNINDEDLDSAVGMALRIKARVDQMERKLFGLLAKNEERAICFSGLGFKTMAKSNAWLEIKLKRHQSQVGNLTQRCQQIFWAVLKSHNVMAAYKRLNFKNHTSIATKLVKFLAINTSFEAIEQLTSKTGVLELIIVHFKKQVVVAVKEASSAANKSDESKKQCNQMVKRVTKLEEKAAKLV
jgi:hypothetical protein